MGLDITAHGNVKYLGCWELSDDDHDTLYDHHQKYVELYVAEFAHAFEGLKEGIYQYDPEQSLHFRAGSYGGYNRFREALAFIADYWPQASWGDPDTYESYPFYEMVHFSDCEGYIGPVAAKELYADFVSYKDKWHEVYAGDDWESEYMRNKYDEWMEAYLLASVDGFVDFH